MIPIVVLPPATEDVIHLIDVRGNYKFVKRQSLMVRNDGPSETTPRAYECYAIVRERDIEQEKDAESEQSEQSEQSVSTETIRRPFHRVLRSSIGSEQYYDMIVIMPDGIVELRKKAIPAQTPPPIEL